MIDYKAFRSTYYDKRAYDIYQKGVLWMIRGVVHLLLYRAVYYYFTISPTEITDLGTTIHYMVSTYMLYLHISGQFHLIIGILCLFGFNLPETHHLFYLASGFSDYYRRVNIYWKDFMMKMFYYPVLMRVRVLGMTTGIVLATTVVFFFTWLLHAYQWFWLRGNVMFTATDSLFWAILCGMVVGNSIIETKFRRKKKRLKAGEWSLAAAVIYSLKVVTMLTTMTVLWTPVEHAHDRRLPQYPGDCRLRQPRQLAQPAGRAGGPGDPGGRVAIPQSPRGGTGRGWQCAGAQESGYQYHVDGAGIDPGGGWLPVLPGFR